MEVSADVFCRGLWKARMRHDDYHMDLLRLKTCFCVVYSIYNYTRFQRDHRLLVLIWVYNPNVGL